MISVSDLLVVVLDATNTPLDVALKFTVTDVTHSGGTIILQVTLAPGFEPLTLSARTVTVERVN